MKGMRIMNDDQETLRTFAFVFCKPVDCPLPCDTHVKYTTPISFSTINAFYLSIVFVNYIITMRATKDGDLFDF